MQIKQDKYNVVQSQKGEVIGKGSDIRLDLKLNFNTKELNLGSSILGTVLDENNKPIQGAVVKLMNDKLDPLTNATTDVNGKYFIDSVPYSSIYNMIAVASGKILSQATSFMLLSGESKIINFTLQADTNSILGAISGTILNNNSEAISGAIVLLYNIINGSNDLIAITYTDISGVFVFSDLNIGDYSIAINALGYIKDTMTASVQSGIITTISKILNIDSQAADGIISGFITDSTNNPVVTADVILYNIDNDNTLTPIAFTRTNSSGMYTFINVPSGIYLIKSNESELVTVNSSTNTSDNTTFSTSTLPLKSYDVALGLLTGQAIINLDTNYVEFLGGPTDASSSTVIVNVSSAGSYNIAIKYISADNNRPMKVDINEINTGTVYVLPKTVDWTINDALVFTIPVNLSVGDNKIKFHGDGINFTPLLGSFSVAKEDISLQTIPTTINSKSYLPVGIYDIALGILENGARVVNSENYTGWIGGPTDGSSTVTVNVSLEGTYNMAIKYIAADTNRPMKVDINGVNTATIYSLPKTAGWTINDALVYTIPVNLKAGNNTIKFHGDGINYAPDLDTFRLIMQNPKESYDVTLANLTNGATIDLATNYIDFLGGKKDGSSTIKVNVTSEGSYNIAIKYISADKNRPMIVDINEINTGIIYSLPKTIDWTVNNALVFTIPVNLIIGENIVKFHGDGINFAPLLGDFTVNKTTTLTGIYDVALGSLAGEAIIDLDTNYVDFLGGKTNNSSTVTVNIYSAGSYNIELQYISADINRTMKIDVNGVNTGKIYTFPETKGWTINDVLVFTIPVNLNVGNNEIKFYGDEKNFAPLLGRFLISLNKNNN